MRQEEIKGVENCVIRIMYLKNYFFFKRVDCIKKIFKLSLKFFVLSLTDVEGEAVRERKEEREEEKERGREGLERKRGGVRKGVGERE